MWACSLSSTEMNTWLTKVYSICHHIKLVEQLHRTLCKCLNGSNQLLLFINHHKYLKDYIWDIIWYIIFHNWGIHNFTNDLCWKQQKGKLLNLGLTREHPNTVTVCYCMLAGFIFLLSILTKCKWPWQHFPHNLFKLGKCNMVWVPQY